MTNFKLDTRLVFKAETKWHDSGADSSCNALQLTHFLVIKLNTLNVIKSLYCIVVRQTLGSDLNGIDRQRDFLSRYSCAGGRSSPTSVDLDPAGHFARTGGVSASGAQRGLVGFPSTAPDSDLPGADHDDKPGADGGRRSTATGSGLPVGRSPGSNKSAGISSSTSSTGNSSAMYDAGTGSDIKHQQLDYIGGGGAGGGLLSSDPLHYYQHLGGVASSAGFSPYQPRHHHPGTHHHHLTPAAYQPYAMPDLDYTSTSAFFHSNVFKAAAAASQIRTKSHSSSGLLFIALCVFSFLRTGCPHGT